MRGSASSDSMRVWSELLGEVAKNRACKKVAASTEDFAEAARYKQGEADALAKLLEAKGLAAAEAKSPLYRQKLEQLKKKAVDEEDYEEAHRLKSCLIALEDTSARLDIAMDDPQPDLKRRATGGAMIESKRAAIAQAVAVTPLLEPSNNSSTAERPAPKHKSSKSPFAESASAKAATLVDLSAPSCVPGVDVKNMLKMTDQDLWQSAWEKTWTQADAEGRAGDQEKLIAQTSELWEEWLRQRAGLRGFATETEAEKEAETQSQAQVQAQAAPVLQKELHRAPLAIMQSTTEEQPARPAPEGICSGADQPWSAAPVSQPWARRALLLPSSSDRAVREETPAEPQKKPQDLCKLLLERCPADKPVPFERFLAVCHSNTTVQQLIKAMSKQPQDFRQNFDGSEFCMRPANSRCVDWRPVTAATVPKNFRPSSTLPKQLLEIAKTVFEERIKPPRSTAEDRLGQWVPRQDGVRDDTPMSLYQMHKFCPLGTSPGDLLRHMSRRKDQFRQDPTGQMFCHRPGRQCKGWTAVNPYSDVYSVD